MRANQRKAKSAALLGVGLDCADGHKRLTRGRDFVLLGGSPETHAAMQETAIKVTETLEKRGKRLAEASIQELRDIFDSVCR